MYGCKYLNFSRSTSELELIARQIIDEHEGVEGVKYISEYSDSNTERGRLLRDEICRRLELTSLEFQTLEGTAKAVGLEGCKLCTYCWNGKEKLHRIMIKYNIQRKDKSYEQKQLFKQLQGRRR